jgi:hypothetical protein
VNLEYDRSKNNDCCRTTQSNNCLQSFSGPRPSTKLFRLEGLTPPADARLLFEKFVQGELTEEQLVDAVLAR